MARLSAFADEVTEDFRGQFGGSTGPTLFAKAIDAVRQLSEDVGLPLN